MIGPFPFLDFLLKTIRNTIFAVLAITALISPHFGLLLCLGVIVFSFLIFAWGYAQPSLARSLRWDCCGSGYLKLKTSPIPARVYLPSPRACARYLGGLTDGFTWDRMAH